MGATIPQQFSDAFINDEFGVVTGTASATQFPTGSCGMVRFKADPSNVNVFKLGDDPSRCLFPMSAGDDTGWVSTSNLNRYYYSDASGSLDRLYWWLQD